jgi:hypothetical protein
MSKMLAMIVPNPGGRFRLEERDPPEPDHHEVRIRVHACGACHSKRAQINRPARGTADAEEVIWHRSLASRQRAPCCSPHQQSRWPAARSPRGRAGRTSGTRRSSATIRMARGASVIDDAGDQFTDD